MTNPSPRTRAWLLAVAIAIATLATFVGVASNGFIQLDDPTYVRDNAVVHDGLSLEGWRYAWTSGDAANWHPLTWFSHMVDVELFGVDAGAHHLVSLALHVLCAVLLFTLALRWTSRPVVSLLVAAFFALHPLRVESVAWIAERKDVLSGAFFLLALHAWTSWARDRKRGAYVFACVALALGLLAKPMLVTLPCLLLVLDVWPFRRVERGWRALVLEKAPLMALAALSSVITFLVQRGWGAVMTTSELGFGERLANALVSYVRYLAMTVWPTGLAAYYPHPRHTDAAVALGAAALLAGVSVWCWSRRARSPWLLAGWLWYLGLLVPVIGFVQVGGQALADRYTYLATIGIVFGVVLEIDARASKQRQFWLAAAVTALLVLAWRTRAQVEVWKDTKSVFLHALEVTENNAMARQQYGRVLLFEGDIDGAIRELSECVRLSPAFPEAQNYLGTALGAKGRFVEAVRCFETAIQLKQDSSRVRTNLGWALLQLGRPEDAERECREAVELDPKDAQAREKLGVVLAARGRTEAALPELDAAIELAPERIEPRKARALALFVLQRDAEAVGEYERVLASAPLDLKSLKNVAWLRATSWSPELVDAAAALAHARKALELAPDSDAQAHDVLGAALAASGDFDAAVGAASRAVELYGASGRRAEAEDVARRIDEYRGRRAYVRPRPAGR